MCGRKIRFNLIYCIKYSFGLKFLQWILQYFIFTTGDFISLNQYLPGSEFELKSSNNLIQKYTAGDISVVFKNSGSPFPARVSSYLA